MYKDQLYSMVAEEADFLNLLPGNHGQVYAPSVKVSIKGAPRLFNKGAQTEWSDGTNVTGADSLRTGQVTIDIAKFSTQIFISREEARYAVTQWSLVEYVKSMILKGAAETITSVIINGDTQSNITTGNVNKKTNGANPVALAGTEHFLTLDNGLRKVAIANTVVAAAAISRSQYQATLLKLGDYAADAPNLMWIASADAATRARTVDGYDTMEKYGADASNVKGGLIEMIEGIKVFKTRHLLSSVSSAGYIETGDDAANTKSQLMLLYKPSIQYAFGEDMVIVPIERAGGWMLDVAMWFGFVVADEVAGLDKVVATAIINKS